MFVLIFALTLPFNPQYHAVYDGTEFFGAFGSMVQTVGTTTVWDYVITAVGCSYDCDYDIATGIVWNDQYGVRKEMR